MLVTLRWVGDVDGHLDLLDQTLLPGRLHRLNLTGVDGVIDAKGYNPKSDS